MEVGLHANMFDSSTSAIARVLYSPFAMISKDLSGDYGGTMGHLWIDLELIEDHAKKRSPYPFRFQKRVGSQSPDRLTGLPGKVYENVGHYSVRPNFQLLRKIPLDSVVADVLSLIYSSTAVLIEKRKKLGGFDAAKFRADFIDACSRHGYDIPASGSSRLQIAGADA
jgi:hypothetical protein